MSSNIKPMENNKRSFFAVLTILLILLISFNGASIFSINIPFPENVAGDSRNLLTSSLANLMYAVEDENPSVISNTQMKLHEKDENPSVILNTQMKLDENTVAGAGDSSRFIAGEAPPVVSNTHLPLLRKSHSLHLKEENPFVNSNTQLKSLENTVAGAGDSTRFFAGEDPPPVISNTHLPLLRKSHSFPLESEDFPVKNKKILEVLTFMESSDQLRRGEFRSKVKNFFSKNESFSCKVRFFMTWISSLNTFSEKEFHSIETLFSTHPKGCLLIVSNSMDSNKGRQILKPFLEKGFRVTAISPDLKYLFKNTMAEPWFMKLTKGDLDVGYVPLGQNLSNLLRLCLLYKFGGVYMDTDVMVLKSFSKLKNSIGAQTLDLGSKNWSRLNNAVMVFDKMHPLVYKFIEEFALTFNGNKWGHNGPYLVSRVVSRLENRPGYNFTILPPMAFYPVNWNRVRNLFRGAKNETDAKWLRGKLRQIRSQSYAVHLWNKQSRRLRIEEGSIVGKILSNHCVFCNSSLDSIVRIE
ncbi:putative glycosyltransferase, DXD sugar-binding, alpha 1,4-glycosyltransferase [Helianthus annuus]|nr:putative glycosyltransferase, DXD sugar-binding, alpha 1,4-glycosyltransferase [Helianthus annuus]